MLEERLKQIYGIDKYGNNVPEWAEEVKLEFVKSVIGDKVYEAKNWIDEMNSILGEAKERLNVKGWLFSREMSSFIKDPLRHLVKKLFIYFHDLVRGKITVNEFVIKGRQAINSSFGSNMRSIYQTWGFASILVSLSNYGYRLTYPEHGYLNFDRSGKQKNGIIPPNAVIENVFGSSFSFFLEAPRPISWEDGSDLEKVWRLYSTLRPDMMIYDGFQMNIVDLDNGNIPIKRPNYILEFKELENWWNRWRYLKGYKPLSGNEWRARWISGLYKGLMDALEKVPNDLPSFNDNKGKRIREYKVIELYKEVYKPDKGVLVSRVKVDEGIKSELSDDIVILDDVGFNTKKFRDLAEDMVRGIKINLDVRELAYKFALDNKNAFMEWLKKHGIYNLDEI
ncbi:hypothetical protein V6M85_09640 [Sulfolobus tengchongensis]|uniref:Uncharacterized protein n=1 Tax=Sulfolobus tengchongensis TaxID=207809 RepID=A0AAX4KXX6_9CREN